MSDNRERVFEQSQIAKELQDLVLADFLSMLKDGTLTSTDRKTLVDLLRANGWHFNPESLPQELKDHITRRLEFDDDINEQHMRIMP